MQQTQTYKLNKPGTDDPIAIAPLNENMEKIEAAILAETAARQSADATETSARQSAIAAEAQARADADAAETQARQSADESEAQTRAAAITAEAQARTAADNSEAQTRAAADASEAQTRAAAVTALNNRVGAVEGRVTALEVHHVAVGEYHGDQQEKFLNLGFTPVYVVINNYSVFYGVNSYSGSEIGAEIKENGIKILAGTNPVNYSSRYYNYFAIA